MGTDAQGIVEGHADDCCGIGLAVVSDFQAGAGPHAVKSIAGAKNASYCYDPNGDMISGDGRTITWSAFGMPVTIAKDGRSIELKYGPDRARVRRIDTNETGTTTTYYLAGGAFEVAFLPSGQITRTAYIGGVATVMETETAPGTTAVETRYLLKNHLGSMDVMTDASGAVLKWFSFDAWASDDQVRSFKLAEALNRFRV